MAQSVNEVECSFLGATYAYSIVGEPEQLKMIS